MAQHTSKYFLAVLLVLMLNSSCGEDCVTCQRGDFSSQFCEDSGIIYTDMNGKQITIDEAIMLQESMGWDCK